MNKYLSKGFTLIELMVVIAIVAILLTLAVPSVSDFLTRYSLTQTSNDFLSSITITRNEALKYGRQIEMAPVGADWTTGWQIFEDKNGNNIYDLGVDVPIGAAHPAMPATFTVTKGTIGPTGTCDPGGAGIPFTFGGVTAIAFSGGGYSRQVVSGASLADDMRITNGSYSRCIVMNMSGRVYVKSN